MGVNGVYNRLWWHIDTHHALLNLDNTTDIGFLRDGSLRSLADGTVTSLTPAIESMWIHLYTGVGRANDLLKSLDKASGVVNKEFLLQVEAEARFLRAYFYHHLVELFGDVPLLTQTPFMEEANIAKSSKLTIVDQIIEDLQFAKDNLPLSWQGDNIGRITKGAATLLMARVALYNCRFELAATASEEIMSSNIYRPVSYTHLDVYKRQAVYGSRAANGVILVTTKRGEVGKPRISYQTFVGLQSPTNQPEFVDGETFMILQNLGLTNVGASPVWSDNYIKEWKENHNTDPDNYPNTNWVNEAFSKQGIQQRHALSISGGCLLYTSRCV